jgi:hypothetical protein
LGLSRKPACLKKSATKLAYLLAWIDSDFRIGSFGESTAPHTFSTAKTGACKYHRLWRPRLCSRNRLAREADESCVRERQVPDVFGPSELVEDQETRLLHELEEDMLEIIDSAETELRRRLHLPAVAALRRRLYVGGFTWHGWLCTEDMLWKRTPTDEKLHAGYRAAPPSAQLSTRCPLQSMIGRQTAASRREGT